MRSSVQAVRLCDRGERSIRAPGSERRRLEPDDHPRDALQVGRRHMDRAGADARLRCLAKVGAKGLEGGGGRRRRREGEDRRNEEEAAQGAATVAEASFD